jgi:hypothetical protein
MYASALLGFCLRKDWKMDKRSGHYLGTEINVKWWKRYAGEGFFARGNCEYWCDDEAFHFLRYLSREPIKIPFDKVARLRIGTWHCGRWAWGKPIVKIYWQQQGESLCSGFTLAGGEDEARGLLNSIGERLTALRGNI